MFPSFITRYQQIFDSSWADDTPVDQVRFVVLDSETTGLNPRVDRIITIGAVAVRTGEIVIEDSFAAMLRMEEHRSRHRPRRHARRESQRD